MAASLGARPSSCSLDAEQDVDGAGEEGVHGRLGVGVAALAAAERRCAHLGGRERRTGVEVRDEATAQRVHVGGLIALLTTLRGREAVAVRAPEAAVERA